MVPNLPAFSERLLGCLKAPSGGNDHNLVEEDGALYCKSTGEHFDHINGVPSLFAPSSGEEGDLTDKVKHFYEENPFPNYEGIEEFGELVNKGIQNKFSADLVDAIGYNKLVLECGCGTGQLSHFLSLNNNHVLGIDMSLSSLELAIEHKSRNQLSRSSFAQMNIFNLALRDASFDVVISHGVLHHTFDARRAFAEIVRKVKPGGIVIVGLYNRPARVLTWIRSKLIGLFGPKIDFVVRSRIHDERKADIWIKDQYFNPHETWHSVDEVLTWFDENDVDFLSCYPPILGTDGENAKNMFSPADKGTRYQRTVTQLSWLSTIAREGALFDMIGRRRDPNGRM